MPGSGFGLRAMAERVRTYGGTVSAGPVPGGFRVLATMPLEGQ
jgi:signal transduction histidine kinase